jgi:mono/diheme cytochrome c family protein
MNRSHRTAATTGWPVFGICALLAAGLGAVLSAGPAGAQDDQPTDYYQGYVTGRPEAPSVDWILAFGGRLYDRWWAALLQPIPEGRNPAYPPGGHAEDADTWRCVTCHGWDLKGGSGPFGEAGVPGLESWRGGDPAAVVAVLRGPGHDYAASAIPDDAALALGRFITEGQADVAPLIEEASGVVRGDAEHGRRIFQNLCAICHGFDGRAWITGEGDGLATLGAIATANPWRAFHRVMNGQTAADMPALRPFGLGVVADVIAYLQTLPTE